jgi:hypothetical protein
VTSTPAGNNEKANPLWSDPPVKRPWLGLALLATSIVSTVAVLVFFGAWLAQDRIAARADETGQSSSGEWWEDGLIAVCPIH